MADPTDPEDYKNLGFSVFRNFRNVNEHLAFAEALENEIEKNSASLSLLEIGASYVETLVSDFIDWPFDEAVLLIDA